MIDLGKIDFISYRQFISNRDLAQVFSLIKPYEFEENNDVTPSKIVNSSIINKYAQCNYNQ